MQRLSGKCALITGGGRGLGRAIALAFAREGAHVALGYRASAAGARETAEAARALGVNAVPLQADLANPDEAITLVGRALDALGGLDVLVNNAGLFSAATALETGDELWDQLLTVNLSAPFRCIRAAIPVMREAGGVVLNLASGGGQHPYPGYDTSPAYAASKAGLIMLSKRLALELAPTIRVNCLAPGIVDSKPRPMSEGVRQRFAAVTPLQRVGRPEEIAAAAVFLASDEAAFITGQVLNVDGGILM